VDGPVEFFRMETSPGRSQEILITVQNVICALKGSDPFGEVEDAHIQTDGRLIPSILVSTGCPKYDDPKHYVELPPPTPSRSWSSFLSLQFLLDGALVNSATSLPCGDSV
jgi:hypothetical protein